VKRSKHITLDDLPPKYREQAKAQIQLWHTPEEMRWISQQEMSKEVAKHIEQAAQGISDHLLKPETMWGKEATAKESLQVRKDRKPKGPNKTEQLFNREMLGGLGQYEAVTLRLPGNSRYTPDYLTSVFDPQEQRYETTVYEVKGSYKLGSHGRALTAFREARAAFPFLTFKWYEKQKGGGWLERYKA